MERYGLIGRPLGHSFSASFFAEKIASEGIDAVYENHELPELAGHFMELVDSTPNLRGLNVTIPYKQDVIPLLNELSDDARAIGAVNVISISRLDDGRPHLKGYNSDVIGFTESIKPLLRECHKKALVLGTGGASKAVVYGLEKLGLATTYVSRTPRSGMLTYENLSADIMKQHLVVVNCTPVGMFPHTDEYPAIPYQLLSPDHLLYDLEYNPLETMFLKKGKERGCIIKNGLEMLHLQAIASWEFWHEHPDK